MFDSAIECLATTVISRSNNFGLSCCFICQRVAVRLSGGFAQIILSGWRCCYS